MGLLLALALLPTRAGADLWYQHYQKAQEALQQQRWEEAVEELNLAIERRGDSGARVRTYGMRTTDYFPYLKLGIAYFHLGNADAALQAFDTEERLSAVGASEAGSAELQDYRLRVEELVADRTAQEKRRIQQILADSLRESRSLRDEGEVEGAMVALGRGLAVAPESPEALALMDELRTSVQKHLQDRQRQQRIENLVSEGETLLAQGAPGEAASRFRQALSLGEGDARIQGLLEHSQSLLREQLAAEAAVANQASFVEQALGDAESLEQSGRLAEALERIQTVRAMEPDNARATQIESRLLDAQSLAEQRLIRQDVVAGELATASEHFSAGRYEAALSSANRVLAVEPGNAAALGLVAQSYGEISRILLGHGAAGNIPPAIRFADFRTERQDGSLAQTVRDPRFQLSGMIIDNSPVEVEFSDDRDQELNGSVQHQQLGDFYLAEFHVTTNLRSGPATIRLVATDAENLTSSSEYAVVYAPAWYRSPWILSLLALGLIGISTAGFMVRWRRRAKRRRRRFNPYVAGAPVLDEDLFFGRQSLIDRILQTIHNNSLLLYGERRIGKTSIQHHLKKRLAALEDPDYRFYPVYVDLQGTPEERFFATISEDVFEQLATHLGALETDRQDKPEEPYSYRDLVRDLRVVIRILEGLDSRRVKLVLLIDEVDELNEYDPRINQRLRSLFMKSFAESLVAVVSGVEIKKQWERVGSPWYNFFEEIRVEPLAIDEARELIEKPIAGVLKIEGGVVERIIELTGGRPYPIQRLCISLVNRAYEEGRTSISLRDVEAMGQAEAA